MLLDDEDVVACGRGGDADTDADGNDGSGLLRYCDSGDGVCNGGNDGDGVK